MSVARPPISEDAFNAHQEERGREIAEEGLASIAAAQQAQEQAEQARVAADAREQQEAEQRSEQQLADAMRPAYAAQERASGLEQAYGQLDQALAPAREAWSRATAPPAPGAAGPSAPGMPGGRGGGAGGGLGRVYQDALASGLNEEGARAAVAVAQTEGGMGGSVGDAGVSAGTFQLHHAGGMGDAYAQAQGLSREQSIARLRADPHAANQWALSGYLGQAIKAGQAQGLSGPALAEYAQRHGQRSVSPERAGQNYQAAQDALGSPSGAQMAPGGPLGAVVAPGAEKAQYGAARAPTRAEAVGQFEQGLDYATAAAICGPVAALALIQANGRNPSLAEVTAMAKQVGWTEAGGMNGVANEKRLLDGFGVASRLDTSPDFGEIAANAASGNPVIISTSRHYYFINDFDRTTGRLHVGKTGTSRKGGGSWMTAQQIADLDGGLNGVLYVDNPQSPEPSVAQQPAPPPIAPFAPPEADRPPSEIEPPSQFPPVSEPRPFDRMVPEISGPITAGGVTLPTPLAIPPAVEPTPPVEPWTPPRRVALEDVGVPPVADLPRTPAAVLEQGATALGNQIVATDEARTAQNQALQEYADARRRGETVDPEVERRAFEGPLTEMAMGVASLGPQIAGRVGGAAVAAAASTAPTSSTVFARFWNRARNVIESQGEAGQELGGKLRDWRDSAERLAGEWTAGMPTVRSLKGDEFREFVAAAEGKLAAPSDRIRKAVEEWDGVRRDAYARAQEAGLDIGKLSNYFPHMFEEGTFRGKGWSDAVTHLVDSGQAATRAEAAQKLRYVQDVRRNRRYGNLESERDLDLPFYRRDSGVLFGQGGYLEGAANRIAQVAHFGQRDAGALDLIDRIGQAGGDARAVKALFDASVGATRYDPDVQTISGALRGANTVMSLGLSAITNAGQFANTAAVAGLGPTARNAWRSLRSPEAKEAAIRAGVTLDNVVQDIREGTGLASRALGRVTAPGFGTVERFNRTLAFHAGVSYADDMAAAAARGDRGARAALERLGLDGADVAQRGVLTEAEKITAGRRVVERTQFKVDPQDLPQWASHPVGKVFAQFKTFSYNQSAFLGREIIQPALRGDLRPLARFMVAGLASGAVTTETKNVIQGREPEQDPTKRILQYFQAAGGLGLVGDVLRITSPILNINADRLDPDRVVTQAVGTALGPTVGTGIEALSGIAQATRGNPTPLERSTLRRIPVVGTTLQNLLVPYKPRTPASTAPAGRSSTAPPRPPAPPKPPRPPGR